MNNSLENVSRTLIVIVLYKSSLDESNSYQSVLRSFQTTLHTDRLIDLMVVNNGPVEIECQTDETIFCLHYVEQLDNPGVSKAYNVAGELARDLQKEWLLLLDQDTVLPFDCWDRYNESIDHYPSIPIHAPKLWEHDILISPCKYSFYRGTLLSPNVLTGPHDMKGHNVLNSGLLVKVKAFHQVNGYDESVPLYFSDFVFFDRIKKRYSTFCVVDIDLKHSLSSTDYSSLDTALDRFLLYCRGGRAASGRAFIRSGIYFITIGARSLLMGRRFGTFAFTRIFLRTWF